MKKNKNKKELWLYFRVYRKTNGFNTPAENVDPNSVYLDFKVPASIPDLRCKGPIPYDMRYSSDNTLEFHLHQHKEDVWEIFHEHATFNEILKSQDDHGVNCVTSPDVPKDTFHETHERFTIGEFIAHLSEYYKQVLQATRDKPEIMLITDEPAQALHHFLKIARYSIDRKTAKDARNVIIDCLLPNFKKYKKRMLPSPEMLRAIRQLLLELANHLSDKCKTALKEYAKDERLTKRDILDQWRDNYRHIQAWSQKKDGRIYEIASESNNSIKSLILTPPAYVNSVLETHYQICPRTRKS